MAAGVAASPPIPPTPDPSGLGGGGVYTGRYYDTDKEQKDKVERIKIEDSEIVAIVELTLKHFII